MPTPPRLVVAVCRVLDALEARHAYIPTGIMEAARPYRAERFYNPAQPRNRAGKWTSGAGGGAAIKSPRRFTSDKEADAFGLDQSLDAFDTMTPAQVDALGDYKGQAYSKINGDLREGIVSKKAKTIDNAIDDHRLSEPVVVYRGMSRGVLGKNELTGSIVTDKALVSTTLKEGVALEFAGISKGKKGVGTVAEIRLPRGQRGLYLDVFEGDTKEFEFLLPRNAKFRVVSDNVATPRRSGTPRRIILE